MQTVLLIDDDVELAALLKEYLEAEGFDVQVAHDGVAGAELACRQPVEIVVLDVMMPKLNGIEATKKIKKVCPGIAILILTAFDYEQYIFALLEAGAAGYLLKDVSGRELVNATEAVFRGESVLHPAVACKVMKQLRYRVKRDQVAEEPLTNRELEVILLAAKGLKNKQIAKKLYVSVRTIEAHLGNIFAKLHVASRTEAILASLNKGWIHLEQLKGG